MDFFVGEVFFFHIKGSILIRSVVTHILENTNTSAARHVYEYMQLQTFTNPNLLYNLLQTRNYNTICTFKKIKIFSMKFMGIMLAILNLKTFTAELIKSVSRGS